MTAEIKLNEREYRDKVQACWMGKSIGGTFGMPFEWKRQVNDVDFYVQDLEGDPVPNDDLDLQLLWLIALEEKGLEIRAHDLAEYWCLYLTPFWAEYGTSKVNMMSGLQPPLSGMLNNDFKDSCGAFIRSEIWACIAPGFPEVAVEYAMEDAIIDHGDGEGTFAEIFCAALESAAFVENDLETLIDIGLSWIPEECGTAAAVRCAIECVEQGLDWREARDVILRDHRGAVHHDEISQEDREKGFADGKIGYDAPSNIAILVLGLLLGGEDFDRIMRITNGCGEDTDCTCATAGSIFGLMHGMSAIPDRWIEPIGHKITTGSLNLGELQMGDVLPQTIDEMTDRTCRVAHRVVEQQEEGEIAPGLSDEGTVDPEDLKASSLLKQYISLRIRCTCYENNYYQVFVDYGGEPTIKNNQSKEIKLLIRNRYKTQSNLTLQWYTPEYMTVSPSERAFVQAFHPEKQQVRLSFELTMEDVPRTMNRAVIEITADGRPIVLHVPITLLNGNLDAERTGECYELN